MTNMELTETRTTPPPPTGLVERWQARQAALATLLERWGATEGERRIAWEAGLIEWIAADGETAVTATMRALCSYDRAEESLLMAWANGDAAQGAVIPPLPDVPELIAACSEQEAWLWAMRLAEESGAEYLYRVASPNFLVFLGLWSVQPMLSDDEGVLEGGAPHTLVVKMLDEVRLALRNPATDTVSLRRLLTNQGDSLHQNAPLLTGDGADPRLLKQTVESLVALGNGLSGRRFGLLPPPTLSEAERDALHKKLLRLRATWLRQGQQEE